MRMVQSWSKGWDFFSTGVEKLADEIQVIKGPKTNETERQGYILTIQTI